MTIITLHHGAQEHQKAPQAAGVIHGDFEKHFIKAEVTAYDDFKENGNQQATIAAGKVMDRGKEYIVKVCAPARPIRLPLSGSGPFPRMGPRPCQHSCAEADGTTALLQ